MLIETNFTKNKLIFDDEKHKYYINNKDTECKSVSTILSVLNKPALIPWATKLTAEYIRDTGIDAEHLKDEDVRKKASNAWKQTRDKAADIGTIIHSIACDISQEVYNENFKADEISKEIDKIVDKHISEIPTPITQEDIDKIKKGTISVCKFLTDYEVVAVEKFVYALPRNDDESPYLKGIAGRYDALLKHKETGIYYIADYKTGSGVYAEHYLQLGGYYMLLVSMLELQETKLDLDLEKLGAMVVHINKDKVDFNTYIIEPVDMLRLAQTFHAVSDIYDMKFQIEDKIKQIKNGNKSK